jgi:hypothetical protein
MPAKAIRQRRQAVAVGTAWRDAVPDESLTAE